MKVYVASSFYRKNDVRAIHRVLREAGHEVTEDWTAADAAGLEGVALANYLRRGAEADIRGVLTADVLVILHDDRGRGMATEFGVALAREIPVIVIGAHSPSDYEMKNVFYHLCEILHVDGIGSVLDILAGEPRFEREKRRAACAS
jgi:nucleoside 2-deoxyribosyltransferase